MHPEKNMQTCNKYMTDLLSLAAVLKSGHPSLLPGGASYAEKLGQIAMCI
jgi:hypothetical protein